jgi:hypothetical protein
MADENTGINRAIQSGGANPPDPIFEQVARHLDTAMPVIMDQFMKRMNDELNKRCETVSTTSWNKRKELLKEDYYPSDMIQRLEEEFRTHKMEGLDPNTYINRYQELVQLVPHMVPTEQTKVERFIEGVIPEIRSIMTTNKPSTMREAITLVNILTREQQKLKDVKGNVKRGNDQASGSGRKRKNKRQRLAERLAAAVVPKAKSYVGVHPKCDRCNYHHTVGECPRCRRCQKVGHWEKYCRTGAKVAAAGRNGTCYKCGGSDHFHKQCPNLNQSIDTRTVNQQNLGNQQTLRIQAASARGKAVVIKAEEA